MRSPFMDTHSIHEIHIYYIEIFSESSKINYKASFFVHDDCENFLPHPPPPHPIPKLPCSGQSISAKLILYFIMSRNHYPLLTSCSNKGTDFHHQSL